MIWDARYGADKKEYTYAKDKNNYYAELKGVEEEIKRALEEIDGKLRGLESGVTSTNKVESVDVQEWNGGITEGGGGGAGASKGDEGDGDCKEIPDRKKSSQRVLVKKSEIKKGKYEQ